MRCAASPVKANGERYGISRRIRQMETANRQSALSVNQIRRFEMALAPGTPFTRPESFSPSNKRAGKQFSIYSQLLPVSLPPAQTFLTAFLSSLSLAAPLAQPKITAVYDELTHTIWVQGEKDMTILWRRGFFGKGALSRSEPSWKRRVENKIAVIEGGVKRQHSFVLAFATNKQLTPSPSTGLTSEEITAQRRIERNASKLVKKAERESEKLIAASAAASEWNSSAGGDDNAAKEEEELVEALNSGLEKIVEELEAVEEEADHVPATEEEVGVVEEPVMEDPPPAWQLSAEHTQLQQEEAFFLLFALGCINITTSNPLAPLPSTSTTPLSILATWRTFLLDSATLLSPPSAGLTDPRLERFDSPFLINYAAYHHFRSMGWVARSGVKFCADWVLYGAGGPVGSHAESVHSSESCNDEIDPFFADSPLWSFRLTQIPQMRSPVRSDRHTDQH